MDRLTLIAVAEEQIEAASKNLLVAAGSLQAARLYNVTVSETLELINAQTGLALACIDLARLK